jgi:two-component system, OmpR family, osmolarity sensor histidine kinase EnvZ
MRAAFAPALQALKLYPRSLLWRTFLLVALVMLLSVAAWFSIFSLYDREPRARQVAQMVASVANLTRAALLAARPEARVVLLRELSDREGIHVYPSDVGEVVTPLPSDGVSRRVQEIVREQLGPLTRVTLELNGERGLFVSFRIEDDDEEEYWAALPKERLERVLPLSWIGWGVAAFLLALAGAWLIVFRITQPLKAMEVAARRVGAGDTPSPLPEIGPSEIATVARAFNQMSAGLERLDQDRALILAGISHDLRTPLTRLRMGIEFTTDESLRDGMIADVEEMDKTIAQFLDFARTDSGEPTQEIDLNALLTEIAAQFARRKLPVTYSAPWQEGLAPKINGRPQAIRRAITNLIDNALRYGPIGDPQNGPELSLAVVGRQIRVDIADRGPGIPAMEVEHMKRPFTRLDDARSNVSGAGLGLAIVERITKAHAGSLELLPRPGGGLIARIVLPA